MKILLSARESKILRTDKIANGSGEEPEQQLIQEQNPKQYEHISQEEMNGKEQLQDRQHNQEQQLCLNSSTEPSCQPATKKKKKASSSPVPTRLSKRLSRTKTTKRRSHQW